MYLAENLKFLREQRGKTQQELAKLFGVEQKTLSSWECGSRTPVIGMIVEMAKYYEVSLDDLVLTDMKPPIPVYALNIAYLRKKYGMTQQELVEIVGLKHKSSISLIEAGKYEPSIEKLENTDSDRIRQNVVTDTQWESFDIYEKFGAHCYVMVSLGLTKFYRVPWATWKKMKELFCHKFMTEQELEPYRLQEKQCTILILEGVELKDENTENGACNKA